MSFQNCINNNISQGLLTEKQAKDLNVKYEQLLRKYKRTLGDTAAAHAAADHLVSIESSILQKRRMNEIRHVVALREFKDKVNHQAQTYDAEKSTAFKGMKWLHGNPYMRAMRDRLERVFESHMGLERQVHMKMSETIEEFRSKNAGFKQDVEGFTDVVREAMGKKTGSDAAAAHGKAVRKAFDELRDMYEQAGGVMGRIDNYFPASHEAESVGAVSFREWSDYIIPRLDREKMVDLDSGLPMDDVRLEAVMRKAYDNIKTNGMVDVAERANDGLQSFGRGGEINMRRTQSRFFHFKDADAFLEYNARFGRGDAGLFDSMMNHISTMSRDVAIMQQMGPKPSAVMANLDLEMQARGARQPAIRAVRGMYDTLAGKNNYGGELSSGYKFVMGWLNVKRAAYLGSAPISAISDTYFVSLAAKANGLPAAKVMGQYAKLLDPTNTTDRKVARHMFYVSSAANGMGLQGARFADDVGRGGKTAFISGAVNRASGLASMTDAGRQAPMMTMAGMFADYVSKKTPWEKLEPEMREAARRFDIGERDWNTIMKARPSQHIDMEDAEWLLPEDVLALGGESARVAAQKYSTWMTQLGNTAVNEPRLLTKAITTGSAIGDAPQGSLIRLMSANVFFAKSFPITIILNQALPALRDASQGRIGRLSSLAVFSTIMGGLAVQVREVTKGNEFRDMDSPDFWLAASLQGGGLGLFGDFLLADHNRYGNTLAGAIPGPVVGSIEQLLKAGDLHGVADGSTNAREILSDLVKIGSREIPGVNLWYSRLLVERGILDQIQKGIDPKYEARMMRIERKRQKEKGSGFWWKPGDISPEFD